MRKRKNMEMIIISAIVAVIVIIVLLVSFLKQEKPTDNADAVPSEPYNISIRSDDIENNPTDYSNMEPGTQFYDDFWHGVVTIVGKQSEVDYDKMLANANGRLITTQNGMFIYVDRTATDVDDSSEDADEAPIYDEKMLNRQGDPGPGDENPEDTKYYDTVQQVDVENIAAAAQGASDTLPNCGWEGLGRAIKRYLIDNHMEKVTTVTIKDNSHTTVGFRTGFECTLDNAEGTLGVYFNKDNGMWRFMYSKTDSLDGVTAYQEYNPVCFVSPSSRQSACDELNEYIGYERFTVEDAEKQVNEWIQAEENKKREEEKQKKAAEEAAKKKAEEEAKKKAGATTTTPAATTTTPATAATNKKK